MNKNIDVRVIEAVNEGKVIDARAIIKVIIYSDRYLTNFSALASAKYAEREFKKIGIDIFKPDDNESSYISNKQQWTQELWDTLRVELDGNFSLEKLEYVVDVMTYLREMSHPHFQIDLARENRTVSVRESKSLLNGGKPKGSQTFRPNNKQSNSANFNQKTGACVGGLIGAGVGLMVGGVGSVAIGAVVGGVAGYVLVAQFGKEK